MTQIAIDERFVVSYQNKRTAREHRIVVPAEQIDEVIAFHQRHGNIVSFIPFMIAGETKDL